MAERNHSLKCERSTQPNRISIVEGKHLCDMPFVRTHELELKRENAIFSVVEQHEIPFPLFIIRSTLKISIHLIPNSFNNNKKKK